MGQKGSAPGEILNDEHKPREDSKEPSNRHESSDDEDAGEVIEPPSDVKFANKQRIREDQVQQDGIGEGKELPDTLSLSFSHTKTRISPADFKVLKLLGQGSFGKVYLVTHRADDCIYAMKVMRKDVLVKGDQVTHTVTERFVMSHLQHPNLVKLRFAFQTSTRLYLVMDFARGGELFYHLKQSGRFSEDRVRFYTAQIALALEYLHTHSVVYRDLKPENILLDEHGNIQLTDFGLSKPYVSDKEGARTFCGTPEYIAPETLVNQSYGASVDWWSLGTLAFEMITGLPPFYNSNVKVMYWQILNSKVVFPDFVSPDARDLLKRLLRKNPERRMDHTTIRRHPFFRSINWDDLYNLTIPPPFKPTLHTLTDVRYFDPVFTKETPGESFVPETELRRIDRDTQAAFEGFTFVDHSRLGNIREEVGSVPEALVEMDIVGSPIEHMGGY
ncbi:Protein kinase domain [Carpediemonas membranifera]|uniref:Protein kinase domain n=1 Tax=Carpediemonas membranifera TaxID=201153 RepID=A0A8J6BV44_9EUKA|nr:Protein kinase domain [Carpediemonas membranifera]|eukprot:KAG9391041.1 Protein kinase domain [Carpediemonas membranifera]